MVKRTNINRINRAIPSLIKGFSLIETLVAIAILSIVIVGPLTLATRSITIGSVTQNQITAFYLAQEGIEFVRNRRDRNFLRNQDWLTNLDSCTGASGCYVDVNFPIGLGSISTADNITICPTYPPACPVKYDGVTGLYYNHDTGTDTVFTRVVKVTENIGGNADEAQVEAIVNWTERIGGARSFTLQENIFNWRR